MTRTVPVPVGQDFEAAIAGNDKEAVIIRTAAAVMNFPYFFFMVKPPSVTKILQICYKIILP